MYFDKAECLVIENPGDRNTAANAVANLNTSEDTFDKKLADEFLPAEIQSIKASQLPVALERPATLAVMHGLFLVSSAHRFIPEAPVAIAEAQQVLRLLATEVIQA